MAIELLGAAGCATGATVMPGSDSGGVDVSVSRDSMPSLDTGMTPGPDTGMMPGPDTGTMPGPDTGMTPGPDTGMSGGCTATACGACTAGSSCGWCRGLGQCFPGTSSGPTGGACAAADWAWTSGQCTAPTDSGVPPTDVPSGTCTATACGACTAGSSCGWCRGLGRCLPGTAGGPSSGACTATDWAWLPSQCTAPTDSGVPPTDVPVDPGLCRVAGTCNVCTLLPTCGWCRRTNSCLGGTAAGSLDGSCSGADWAWRAILTC